MAKETQLVTFDAEPSMLADFDETWKRRGYMARAEALRELMRSFVAQGQAALPLNAERPA
jgi:metal-responsive CopG/Arc/MetJ family transcriptional regulator